MAKIAEQPAILRSAIFGEPKTPKPSVRVAMMERHYSPQDLANWWGLSAHIIRELAEQFDVLVVERPERLHKRRYRTMRIPEHVAVQMYKRLLRRGS